MGAGTLDISQQRLTHQTMTWREIVGIGLTTPAFQQYVAGASVIATVAEMCSKMSEN
jgi:hypothetical protein